MPLQTLPVRILVADDSASFRQALCVLLDQPPMLHVVATARDGRDAVLASRRHTPDLVILDVRMPVMGGRQAAVAIREMLPDSRILLLSVDPEALDGDPQVAGVMDGFIPKVGLQRTLWPTLERLFPLLTVTHDGARSTAS
ncbi:MAG: response regulator transcription factor [Gemmatimonadales bacterium]|nr:response regulator transcription factor [Gemmatimonadales bacterium]